VERDGVAKRRQRDRVRRVFDLGLAIDLSEGAFHADRHVLRMGPHVEKSSAGHRRRGNPSHPGRV